MSQNRQRLQKLFSPSLIFVGSQAAVGAGNYLFQIAAAKILPLHDFGEWSVWFAQFAITLLIATWVQSLATLDGRLQPLFGPWLRPQRLGLTISGLIVLMIAGHFAEVPLLLSVAGWGWAVLQAVFYGRALALGQLYLISFAMLVAVGFRVLVPVGIWMLGYNATSSFYMAVLFTPLVTVAICAVGLIYRPAEQAGHSLSTRPSALILFTSLLLAAVISWAPQFDILVAGQILDSTGQGYFGRVALVYKAFFFLILIFAQLLLSKQVQGARDVPLKYLLAVVGLCSAFAVLLNFTFPAEWGPSHWAALGVMHIGTLTFLFLVAQTEISRKGWRWSSVILGSWLVEFALAATLKPTIEEFYAAALVIDLLLVAYFSYRLRRRGSEILLKA